MWSSERWNVGLEYCIEDLRCRERFLMYALPDTEPGLYTFRLATFAVVLFLPRRRKSSFCFSSLEKALFHVKARTLSTSTCSNLQIGIILFVFLLVIRVHDIGWSG